MSNTSGDMKWVRIIRIIDITEGIYELIKTNKNLFYNSLQIINSCAYDNFINSKITRTI